MTSFAALLRAFAVCAAALFVLSPASAQEAAGVYFAKDAALQHSATAARARKPRLSVAAAFGVSVGDYGIRAAARASLSRAGLSVRGGLHIGHCTPAPLRAFVGQWGLRVISAHRPGARVRGSGRVSLHAHCKGHSGAVDAYAPPGKTGAVIAAARARGYGVGTYSGCHHHVHISVGGREWRFHQHYVCGRGKRR